MTKSRIPSLGANVKVPATILRSLASKHLSEREIATHLCALGYQTSRSTVNRNLKSLQLQSGERITTKTLHNQKLNQRDRRMMVRSIRLRNKRRTAELYTELLENNYNVCKRTVLRNLRKVATLRLSRPQQRPLLTRQHMKQRLL
jgi:arginine repressor